MIASLPWVSALVLILMTWWSAVASALFVVSRTALEEHLAKESRERQAQWLFGHLLAARLAVALLRTILRVGFFALVLLQVAEPIGGEPPRFALSWLDLLLAAAITLAFIWVFATVVASAIARHAPVAVLSSTLPLIRAWTVICLPLVRAMAFLDEMIRRLSGASERDGEDEPEAELLRRIEDTQREGQLDQRAATLMENVVEFSSTDVGQVMIPRTAIDGIELTNDLAAIRAFIVRVGHSRIPVYEENLDHIVGILYVKDLVRYLGEDASEFELRPLLRQPIVVPETKPVGELLTDFQRSEVHMAIVIDEYGGTAGLVTIEDVLEEIVGEIQDEHDPEQDDKPVLLETGPARAEVDGRYHIDDLNERLGLDLPEDEEFDTIAGFILAMLGRMPDEGESLEAHGARFTVLRAMPTHIQRIAIELLVQPVPADGKRSKE